MLKFGFLLLLASSYAAQHNPCSCYLNTPVITTNRATYKPKSSVCAGCTYSSTFPAGNYELDLYYEYGQNLFERYITYADHWCQDNDYRDPETGQQFDRAALNEELEKIEKPAGIANPKDFRNDVVQFYLRHRAKNSKSPSWNSYEKIKNVIEKRIFSKTEDLIPVISFTTKASKEEETEFHKKLDKLVHSTFGKRKGELEEEELELGEEY